MCNELPFNYCGQTESLWSLQQHPNFPNTNGSWLATINQSQVLSGLLCTVDIFSRHYTHPLIGHCTSHTTHTILRQSCRGLWGTTEGRNHSTPTTMEL